MASPANHFFLILLLHILRHSPPSSAAAAATAGLTNLIYKGCANQNFQNPLSSENLKSLQNHQKPSLSLSKKLLERETPSPSSSPNATTLCLPLKNHTPTTMALPQLLPSPSSSYLTHHRLNPHILSFSPSNFNSIGLPHHHRRRRHRNLTSSVRCSFSEKQLRYGGRRVPESISVIESIERKTGERGRRFTPESISDAVFVLRRKYV